MLIDGVIDEAETFGKWYEGEISWKKRGSNHAKDCFSETGREVGFSAVACQVMCEEVLVNAFCLRRSGIMGCFPFTEPTGLGGSQGVSCNCRICLRTIFTTLRKSTHSLSMAIMRC